jgi:cytochrome b561
MATPAVAILALESSPPRCHFFQILALSHVSRYSTALDDSLDNLNNLISLVFLRLLGLHVAYILCVTEFV